MWTIPLGTFRGMNEKKNLKTVIQISKPRMQYVMKTWIFKMLCNSKSKVLFMSNTFIDLPQE